MCQADPNSAIGMMEIGVDLSFGHDIYLNFRTAYFSDEGKLIRDAKQIAFTYLKGWFLVDFISIFPFEVVVDSLGNINPTIASILGMSRCGPVN